MDWVSQHGIQLLLLAAYAGMLLRHAWIGHQKTSSLPDYLVAGRTMGGVVIGLSYYATFLSTNSFVGMAGKSWEVGLIWYIKAFIYGGACLLAWTFVAPRFVAKVSEYNSLTVADFLGYRYGSMLLRRISAVVICFASICYLIAVYKGSALALGKFLDLDYQVAAVLVFVVVTAYTLAGGFRSVVLTDAVQGLLMAVGAVGLAAAVLWKGGGLFAVLDNIKQRDPQLVSWEGHMPLLTVLGIALAGGLKFMVEPRQLSRFYGLKDMPALRRGRTLAPALIFVTYLLLLPIGAFAHALIPESAITDSDEVVPYLLGTAQLFGPMLSSLFLLVLVSAALSSLDSVLLVAAASVDHDLILPDSGDSRAIARTRIWVFILSLASMLLALNPFADIVEITAFSGSVYGACFLPSLVFGLYWKRGTAAGSLACVVAGAATVVGWYLARSSGRTSLHEVYPGVAVGVLTYFGVSLITSPNAGSDQPRSATR